MKPSTIQTPLITYTDRVRPEWIDQNDHMNTMHYKTVTNFAMRALFQLAGLHTEYLQREQKTLFQLEMHICYERELRRDDAFEIHSWLMGAGPKRLHHFHEIIHSDKGYRAATVELMTVHIDRTTRRSQPFPEEMQREFAHIALAHGAVPRPDKVSRAISMTAESPR